MVFAAKQAAFFSGLYVRIEDFRLVEGKELITTYEAPILREPPAYGVSFCGRCGPPVPNPDAIPAQQGTRTRSGLLEIPTGLLDDYPGMNPDKHIFIEMKSPWFEITDGLPQYDLPVLLGFARRDVDGIVTPRREHSRPMRGFRPVCGRIP